MTTDEHDGSAAPLPVQAAEQAALRAAAARHYLGLPDTAQADLCEIVPGIPALHLPCDVAYQELRDALAREPYTISVNGCTPPGSSGAVLLHALGVGLALITQLNLQLANLGQHAGVTFDLRNLPDDDLDMILLNVAADRAVDDLIAALVTSNPLAPTDGDSAADR